MRSLTSRLYMCFTDCGRTPVGLTELPKRQQKRQQQEDYDTEEEILAMKD